MRRPGTPRKRTPEKSRAAQSPRRAQDNQLYFCHFKNGMYMGGINAFQKNGTGIFLHDNGTSALTQYHNDFIHGHNVYFLHNCLISAEFVKNKCKQAVLRIPNYILYMKYSADQPEGDCMVISYATKSIIYVLFRKGNMIEKKQEKQYAVLNRVFELNHLDALLGKKHARILNYQFERNENIHFSFVNNKLTVGYFRKGLLNGVGFTLLTKKGGKQPTSETLRYQDQFSISFIQRGYFVNSQLNGLGQKHFKNGNIYIGDFKTDTFQGNGILKNTLKNNWVHAFFQNGNMSELFDYSHEGESKKFQKMVEGMHQRKTNWINNEVKLFDPEFLYKELQNLLNKTPTTQIKNLEVRKKEVLKKIQDNFICDSRGDSPLASSRNIRSYHEIEADILKPNTSSFQGQVKGFNGESQKSQQYLYRPNKGISQNSSFKLQKNLEQSSGRKSSYRKTNLYEKPSSYRSHSQGLLKLQEVQMKGSTSRQKNIQNKSTSKLRLSKSTYGKKEKKQLYPFNLDSKRIIGKSRIFRYLNNDSEENPPHFNLYETGND